MTPIETLYSYHMFENNNVIFWYKSMV
jgi:hypothetical protein